MRIGIIALALVFLASGLKNLTDSGLLGRNRSDDDRREQGDANSDTSPHYNGGEPDKRKLLYSVFLTVLGMLVLVYYFVSMPD